MSEALILNTDCISGLAQHCAPESSDLCVTSIPFGSLFTYSGKNSDIGNNSDYALTDVPNPFGPAMHDIWRYAVSRTPGLAPIQEGKHLNMAACSFALHMRFFVAQLLRVLKPGCNCCIHVQQLLRYKNAHGYAGRRDFRGAVVDIFESGGFEWKAEVAIPKNPQIIAQRIKLHSLQFITGKRNAADLGPAVNDYVMIFQKPGERENPIRAIKDLDAPDGWVTTEEWIRWARGVWDDIHETDVLEGVEETREEKDEKHVCPLQLEVVRRLVQLYTNPGEVVIDPFMGIGSTAWIALGAPTSKKAGELTVSAPRGVIGFELKEVYWRKAVRNSERAKELADKYNTAAPLFAGLEEPAEVHP